MAVSEYTAIADVGETLIRLLRDNMNDLIPADSVVLMSPADVEGQEIRLTLFLYSVVENPYLKNQQMRDLSPTQLQYPSLPLDLHYLLTAFASTQIPERTERTLEEHRILGRAMRIFHDNAIVDGSVLQGNLAGTSEELRIILNTISLEDLTRIWGVFPNRPYRPSISYMVTPVTIDSTRITEAKRVVLRDLEYFHIKARK